MMVYWRFIRDAPSEWKFGYVTWLTNGLVRMGRWNMDTTYGPVVDPKEIEMKEYAR